MNRRNFVYSSAAAGLTLLSASIIGCRKDSFGLDENYQTSSDTIKKILTKESDLNHERVFLVSKKSHGENARLSRRFETNEIMHLIIQGVVFLGNDNTTIKENMSSIVVGDKKYFIIRYEKPQTMSIPVRSTRFANQNKQLTYIVEQDKFSNSTRTVIL